MKITKKWLIDNAAGHRIKGWHEFISNCTDIERDLVADIVALDHLTPCQQAERLRRLCENFHARAQDAGTGNLGAGGLHYNYT